MCRLRDSGLQRYRPSDKDSKFENVGFLLEFMRWFTRAIALLINTSCRNFMKAIFIFRQRSTSCSACYRPVANELFYAIQLITSCSARNLLLTDKFLSKFALESNKAVGPKAMNSSKRAAHRCSLRTVHCELSGNDASFYLMSLSRVMTISVTDSETSRSIPGRSSTWRVVIGSRLATRKPVVDAPVPVITSALRP